MTSMAPSENPWPNVSARDAQGVSAMSCGHLCRDKAVTLQSKCCQCRNLKKETWCQVCREAYKPSDAMGVFLADV
jgi:hypothetical protein